jgi:putative hydrolases of HD superfamily
MVTKAAGPDELLDLDRCVDPALISYLRLMRLKRLYRQGWLKRGLPEGLCESVAEHSFGTAFLALLLGGKAGDCGGFGRLDSSRAALLALVHEMGEAYAGDITPVDGVSREEKEVLEREAIGRALGEHPDREWFLSLWEEFEEGSTPEAAFVRQLDRLEMGLQAALQEAEGFPGMSEFYDSARRTVKEPRLRSLLEEAIEAAGLAAGSLRVARAAEGSEPAAGLDAALRP